MLTHTSSSFFCMTPQPSVSTSRRRCRLTCLYDVTCFSHRGVSAQPLQRADQLIGGRRRRQLRRRHAVSSGRAEDRPADPGRAAHAQRSRHGAGRPRHRGHVQDGQAVMPPASKTITEREGGKKFTNGEEQRAGRTPSLVAWFSKRSDLALDSVKPFERMRHLNRVGGGRGRRPVAFQGAASPSV